MQLSICQAVKGENRGTCTTSLRETPVEKGRDFCGGTNGSATDEPYSENGSVPFDIHRL